MQINDSGPVSLSSQVRSRRRLDERPTQMWCFPGQLECVMTPRPLTRLLSNFYPYHLAANKDANTIRPSTPRRSTKIPCRRRTSTSAVSPSSLFPCHGPSRSNWCTIQSRIPPTVPRCFASALRNAPFAGGCWTRAVLSVTRFHSRNQGSMLSCRVVLVVPSHFPHNQDPDTINRPISLLILQTADSTISSMLPLSTEPASPLINPNNPLRARSLFNRGSCTELLMYVPSLRIWVQ